MEWNDGLDCCWSFINTPWVFMRLKAARLLEGSIVRCTSAAMGGSVLHLEVGLSEGWDKRERERCLGLSFAYLGDVCDNGAFQKAMMVAGLVRFIIHPQLRMFTMHFLPAIVLPSQSAHKNFSLSPRTFGAVIKNGVGAGSVPILGFTVRA